VHRSIEHLGLLLVVRRHDGNDVIDRRMCVGRLARSHRHERVVEWLPLCRLIQRRNYVGRLHTGQFQQLRDLSEQFKDRALEWIALPGGYLAGTFDLFDHLAPVWLDLGEPQTSRLLG
jgi:hypothetical protein